MLRILQDGRGSPHLMHNGGVRGRIDFQQFGQTGPMVG
jgi:hypothetical protein